MQREHIKLIEDPETAKLSSGERNKIVAERLGLNVGGVSAARFGFGKHAEFADQVDPRLIDRKRQGRGTAKKEEFFLAVQGEHLGLLDDPEHKDKSWDEKDEIVAEKMSTPLNPISKVLVLRVRLGLKEYADFARRVPKELRGTPPPMPAAKRVRQVKKEHLKLLKDAKTAKLNVFERDAIVAKNLGMSTSTVYQARIGHGSYADFRHLLDPRLVPKRKIRSDDPKATLKETIRETFYRVREELRMIDERPLLRLLDTKHKDKVVAERLGLHPEIVGQARRGYGPYEKFSKFVDQRFVREEQRLKTFLVIMHAYDTLLKHPTSLGMRPREMDAFLSERLGLGKNYILNARCCDHPFADYTGYRPESVERVGKRTVRETFDLVQKMHTEMRNHPDYEHLDLSERDHVIAARLMLHHDTVGRARRGKQAYEEFADEVQDWMKEKVVRHSSIKPRGSFDGSISGVPALKLFKALWSTTGHSYFSHVLTDAQREQVRENFALVLSDRERKEFHSFWVKKFPDVRFDSAEVMNRELKALRKEKKEEREKARKYKQKTKRESERARRKEEGMQWIEKAYERGEKVSAKELEKRAAERERQERGKRKTKKQREKRMRGGGKALKEEIREEKEERVYSIPSHGEMTIKQVLKAFKKGGARADRLALVLRRHASMEPLKKLVNHAEVEAEMYKIKRKKSKRI